MLLLGIDVGTSAVKTILIDERGDVLAVETVEHPISTPRPLWSEQDPQDWWRGCVTTVRRLLDREATRAAEIGAIGLTGQMHGLVALDARGEVLRPAILWNDQRTSDQCATIEQRVGRARLIEITGKPVLANFTAPKLLWVHEHEPRAYDRIHSILLPKDYVRYRLTGELATDVTDASGTSLFDVSQRRWSGEIIDALDIPRAWLPHAAESPEIVARVSKIGAEATGLRPGTPVVAGAGDQAAEAIGCGIVREGEISLSIGTSGVVFASLDTYEADPSGRLHTYAHALPGAWHMMGVMLSAGGSVRWMRDTLCAEELRGADLRGVDAYDVMTEQAARVAPGCGGLVFLPYLSGERSPHADPFARGAFVGLTMRHTRPHLIRAVLEGVTFGLRDSIELVRARGRAIDRIRVSGGGARSAFWRQMMADVFGAQIATVNVSKGAAFGAAILAGVGAGAFPSVPKAVDAIVRESGLTRPDQESPMYEPVYEVYRSLYPLLADAFGALSRLPTSAGGRGDLERSG